MIVVMVACFALPSNARKVQIEPDSNVALRELLLAFQSRVPINRRSMLSRSNRVLMDDEASGNADKGAMTKEETDALYKASVCKEKVCSDKFADEHPTSSLLNAFTRPQQFFSLLRNPREDPPEEIWDVIREKWPVLKGKTNAELLEALKPIKAEFVDLRFL
jgi:hypothetical protein